RSWASLLTESKLNDKLGTCRTEDKGRDEVGKVMPNPRARDLDPFANVIIELDEMGCNEENKLGLPVMWSVAL
ncbi:hypothetical protein, partial [Heyndrickxia coagulans]|uniref:hypothetical protein n=1 Tax=Heyndrickxia coagulans TaxID=1398 RepID=UPI00214D8DD1